MLRQAPIEGRNQFGRLLTALGLTGRAAEVGTHRGEFSNALLKKWPGSLRCIDPWSVPPGYEGQAETLRAALGGAALRAADMTAARARLARHAPRFTLHKATSAEAADGTPDGSLDFVYIDGDHRYEQVVLDLGLWWPKLRRGGLLAGHDFICPGETDGGWGAAVQPAVLGFCAGHAVDTHLVVEQGGLPWSYYMIKQE